jgi:hypothetical protein
VALTALSVLLLSLGSYLFEVYGRGVRPLDASQVFQPAVVLESLAAFVGIFTLRRTLGRQAPDLPFDRLITGGAVRSFGIFLAHPLVLQVVSAARARLG